MNYELAKELKDAGFPQKPSLLNKNPNNMRAPGFYLEADTETVYVPTLSELIEACPKEYLGGDFTLRSCGDIWNASYDEPIPYESDFSHLFLAGPTPESAVANLYLALHPVKE